ncbi:hypothetical protein RGQ29_012899 [Quercus rubra]|uniref:RING-type domain-containing protein n=1 Tax=Quercus rubra TaxID=3512 RepID=A0AAN7JB28_QUERU|nr:hypothetical protein RGQ29_012899 [Quercus rubra]
MAGSLPGVECARRRRFHRSVSWSDSPNLAVHGGSRRSSFCLYTSNRDTHHSYTSSLQQRTLLNQASQDEKLEEVAREAKERLDGKLRKPRKSSETKRLRCAEERSMVLGELHTQVFGSKKSGSRRFSWTKLSWKASDQDDCAVCLELFKAGETLVHLPCAHRFHVRCLVPWLENNAHCPCCRMGIIPQ